MTHDELLLKLDLAIDQWAAIPRDPYPLQVIRAVVELHKPMKYKTFLKNRTGCEICEENFIYPCPTIQAIEKELK